MLKYYMARQLLGFLSYKTSPSWFHVSCPSEMLWYNQITRWSPPAHSYSPTSFPHALIARSQNEAKPGKSNQTLPVSAPSDFADPQVSVIWASSPMMQLDPHCLQCQERCELRWKSFTGDSERQSSWQQLPEREQVGLSLLYLPRITWHNDSWT